MLSICRRKSQSTTLSLVMTFSMAFLQLIVVLSLRLAVSKLNKLISLCRLYVVGRTSNNRSIFSWHNFLYCMLYFCIFRLFCFSFPWSVHLFKFFWLSYFCKSYFFCVDSEVWCRVKLNCKSKLTYFAPFPNSFSFLWLCYN